MGQRCNVFSTVMDDGVRATYINKLCTRMSNEKLTPWNSIRLVQALLELLDVLGWEQGRAARHELADLARPRSAQKKDRRSKISRNPSGETPVAGRRVDPPLRLNRGRGTSGVGELPTQAKNIYRGWSKSNTIDKSLCACSTEDESPSNSSNLDVGSTHLFAKIPQY